MISSAIDLPAGGIIFLRRFCEVTGGQLAPIANSEKRRRFEAMLRSSHYPVYPLRNMAISSKRVVDSVTSSGCYVGLENIDGETGAYVATQEKESIGAAIEFSTGQILFPKLRPYLNKTHLAGFDGICSTEFHVLTPKGISGRYLTVILRSAPIVGITSLLMTGNTLPRIQTGDVWQLPVPVPPSEIQDEIADMWQKALQHQARQIDAAGTLLRSIDDLLLDELGIPRRPDPPNTLENRMFRRDFSSVSGKRIDPAAHWKRLSLAGGKFPLRRLHDVAAINPPTRFPQLGATTLVSFVPMDAVSDVFGEIATLQTRPLGQSGSYTPFQEEDIIWAKITPCMENGKSALARNLQEGIGYGSTEFHVFRRRIADLCPDYLHCLLRLQMVREHARLNLTGASGHQRVDEDFFYRMEIPFPPLDTQKRIAAHTETIKEKARTLFAEAHAGLDKAKCEIEALILGQEVN
jgi:type I restriction enzyme S subunit